MLLNEHNQNKSSIDKLFERSNISKIYRKGQYIYQEGEVHRGIFRIQIGRVKLWKQGSGFYRSLILYFVFQTEIFGVIDFFKGGKERRCSAIAMDEEVVIQFIPISEFNRVMFGDANFIKQMFELVVDWEQIIYEKYVELQSNNIDIRVYKVLQYLAKRKGTLTVKGIVLKTITHQDISDYVGISRQSVTYAFKNLEKAGKIEYNRKHILIKK